MVNRPMDAIRTLHPPLASAFGSLTVVLAVSMRPEPQIAP